MISLTRAESINAYQYKDCVPCLVVLQLYLEDLEVKVTPVDKSPPSLSPSWLSWAGTAVNLGPRLLLLHRNKIVEDVDVGGHKSGPL